MKRRTFLKRTALTSGAIIGAPYILPTGRLFAESGNQIAKHVVLVMFAGGVRQQESVLQRYLDDSQNFPAQGNIMYNMLDGAPPSLKVVYGTTSPGGQLGAIPIPSILSNTLQKQGTLFPEVRFSKAGTGHFIGLSTAVSGYYAVTQGLLNRPVRPTIFEYARRHLGYKATDTWFIGNGIGNSTPLLNHSNHEDYGMMYGANFIAPRVTFGTIGEKYISNFPLYHPTDEMKPMRDLTSFLNNVWDSKLGGIPGLNNTPDEKESIKRFVRHVFDQKASGQIQFPSVTDNSDLATIGYATEVLNWFKPKLTVINMGAVDGCHSNFTGYLRALHRADHAVGHIWNYIQTQIPQMAGQTAIMVMPEHGRNLKSNPIIDDNDWFAFDHDSDPNSRRIFNLMAGPGIDANRIVGSESNPVGDAADVVPTIAELLGMKSAVINAGLIDSDARSLFDRI